MYILADRYNEDKLQWTLVDFNDLSFMVQVLQYGAKKYKKHNWRKGDTYCRLCDSLLRHIFALLDGEDIDKESNLPHIGHIQANAMFLGHTYNLDINELDDRYKQKIQE